MGLMNQFGVCKCDPYAYEPVVTELKRFDTYEEAYDYYMKQVVADEHYPYTHDKNLWYVWIEDNRIVQFEQLTTKTKCKIVEVPDES